MAPSKVHHLNCATMCPFPGRSLSFAGSFFAPGRMVCHCLLVESRAGLVLVDTGFGLADVAERGRRLGRGLALFARPRFDPEETATRQIVRLGFRVEDVKHIVPTHLDPDHAGGLGDFPKAKVHVREPEHAAALGKRGLRERYRYLAPHFAHGPDWVIYPARGGESWLGLEGVQPIAGVPDVLLVPLGGHSRGHTGVAVETESGWLLHAGDAYFARSEIDPDRPRCPFGLAIFQRLLDVDGTLRHENQARLRELTRARGSSVRIFCAHDSEELAAFGAGER
jgi:glyoxylase-like metal-dependent hydrolase (beta-lactamase superfamily II)